jgi:hypothetical protein
MQKVPSNLPLKPNYLPPPLTQQQQQQQQPTWTFSSHYNTEDPWNFVSNQSVWPESQTAVWNTSWTVPPPLLDQNPLLYAKHISTNVELPVDKQRKLPVKLQPPTPPASPYYFVPVTSQQSWETVAPATNQKIKQPNVTPSGSTTTPTPSSSPHEFVTVKHHQNSWNPTKAQTTSHSHSSSKGIPTVSNKRSHDKASNKHNNDIEDELNQQSLYKTELCRSWTETGKCRYGSKCQFAHGKEELRPVIRHPKYKTEICKTFHTLGTCPYGTRCRFIHNLSERKGKNIFHTFHLGFDS